MAKVVITDEMVARACKHYKSNAYPSLEGDMPAALDAALNPPCDHKWNITHTPYTDGENLVTNYRCDKCGEMKVTCVVSTWPDICAAYNAVVFVTDEMHAAGVAEWTAWVKEKPTESWPSCIARVYRAMRGLEPKRYAKCNDTMRTETCPLGDKCCMVVGPTWEHPYKMHRRKDDPR